MVKLKDISKKTGYSTTTISRALNGHSDIGADTIRKIKKIADEMGYVPNATARNLKMKKSWTIGIVFEEMSGIGLRHPLFAEILDGFKKSVEKAGYDIMFISSNKESYLKHAVEKQLDAVFVLCSVFEGDSYQELAQSNIPVIVIDHFSNNIYNITSDNRESIHEVVSYLYSLGHKKIAHIYGVDTTFTGKKRRQHFYNAMEDLGLELCDEYMVDGNIYTLEDGRRAMRQLLTLDSPPTAVFCACDMLAIGAIQAINEAGLRCPDDVSVVGFDGIEISSLVSPSLTTVRQRTFKMGEVASEYLIDMIDKKIENEAKTIYIDTEFVIGGSTKSIK